MRQDDKEPDGRGSAGQTDLSGQPNGAGSQSAAAVPLVYLPVKEQLYRLGQPAAISPGAVRQRRRRAELAKRGIKSCSFIMLIAAYPTLKAIGNEIKSGDPKDIAKVLRKKAADLDPERDKQYQAEIGAKVLARMRSPVIGRLLRKLLAL